MIREVELACRIPFGRFGRAVIACRRLDIAVSRQFRHRRNIHAPIQQIADKGTPEVMGGKRLQTRLCSPFDEHLVNGLCTHPASVLYDAAFVDRHEQRPRMGLYCFRCS